MILALIVWGLVVLLISSYYFLGKHFSWFSKGDLSEKYENLLKEHTLAVAEKVVLESQNKDLMTSLGVANETITKITNQKKSSEVRTGLIAEQMAPFLSIFPYDSKCAHFLGKPIDFICFTDSGIHFVEIKSGGAQLTSAQRKIRDDIEQKRITFEILRIDGG